MGGRSLRDLTTAEVVAKLQMQPHPEGGFYVETFRDPALVADGRNASTAIYFLLEAGKKHKWHRVVGSSEIFHHYAGGRMDVHISGDGGATSTVATLGEGEDDVKQIVVPPSQWQRASVREGSGDWALVRILSSSRCCLYVSLTLCCSIVPTGRLHRGTRV